MVNKVLAAFMAVDGLFVAMGAVMLGFSVIVRQTCFDAPTNGNDAARDLLYREFPFTAGIANAIVTFVVFLCTLPALATNSRGWLKLAGYLVVIDALFSLIIGVDLWVLTLKMKETYQHIWIAQNGEVQELMQTAFQCCGYFNASSPAFITDATCPSPAAAALLPGCSTPLTSFGNTFVDNIFTAVFGMVGIDALFVMAIACLLKDRKEQERYRHIDEKSGARGGF
ncbi:Uu.00g112100.m01.CDS01 [Anthostomella pinea]|uniref:Uu.00g112100.m01.CDS01 n=1 Tax=Anthostomella pinea TaxID=933095 RepID=A0AAI8VA25_9PEZI|nr:Uu.00g112100.m01.CDS01 [Anthostomella pinea]